MSGSESSADRGLWYVFICSTMLCKSSLVSLGLSSSLNAGLNNKSSAEGWGLISMLSAEGRGLGRKDGILLTLTSFCKHNGVQWRACNC